MAARQRARRPGIARVRRIVRSQARQARARIAHADPPSDAAIHDARKRIKRARAALRLLREALGEARFRRDNRALRDASAPLSTARDGRVLLETLEDLARNAARPERAALARMRQDLEARAARARRRLAGRPHGLARTLDLLRSAGESAGSGGGAHGWSALGPGLCRVYRSGRRALDRAVSSPTDDNLHELRKQVKYLWHALAILEPLRPSRLARAAKQAHRLSRNLGQDHDLALLRQCAVSTCAPARSAAPVLRAIDRRRTALQRRALALARRAYTETPRAYVTRLHRYWRAA
jgi:CHAD domain-containing protein